MLSVWVNQIPQRSCDCPQRGVVRRLTPRSPFHGLWSALKPEGPELGPGDLLTCLQFPTCHGGHWAALGQWQKSPIFPGCLRTARGRVVCGDWALAYPDTSHHSCQGPGRPGDHARKVAVCHTNPVPPAAATPAREVWPFGAGGTSQTSGHASGNRPICGRRGRREEGRGRSTSQGHRPRSPLS